MNKELYHKPLGMQHTKYKNLFFAHLMKNAIFAHDNFAITGITYLRDHTAQLLETDKFLDTRQNILHKPDRPRLAVLPDIFISLPQIILRARRPDNFFEFHQERALLATCA